MPARSAPLFLLALFLLAHSNALSLSDSAPDFLLKTAPRPAGMGGAFTAVPLDPIGLFWNPAAALRSNRLSFSHNHSLRHFPGARKNLDQLDSDTAAAVFPLRGDNVLGLGFSVPGEWGIDHNDTNGVLKEKERFRGRERRIAGSDLRAGARSRAGELDSNWYRDDSGPGGRTFQSGAGFSFFYETDNGMMYGFNVRGLASLLKKQGAAGKTSPDVKVTLGAAYREDPRADTLAAADLELHWKKTFRTRFFAGAERGFDDKFFLRAGNMDGSPTYGAGVRFGSVRLDYAEVKNFLPKISGDNASTLFQDAHFFSYTVSIKND